MTRREIKLFCILLVLALCCAFGGCAVCDRHPIACRVAVGVVVVAAVGEATALGIKHMQTDSNSRVVNPGGNPAPNTNCTTNPSACQ